VIRFKSTITIWKGEDNFSAASILEVLSADLDCGARVILEAVGPDEQEALNELEALLLVFVLKKTPLRKLSFVGRLQCVVIVKP
jgi:phosphotransferase system HPr-like phosphotransfer protein